MPSIEPEQIRQPLHVAVGVIEQNGKILITRRAEALHQGGKWEFPGGKVESGETVQEALNRELEEELGIRPESITPLIRIPWSYPDRHVLLDVWRVSHFSGTPHPREGQPMSWAMPDQLAGFDFPAANHPIIRALNLPDRLLVTPEPEDQHDFLHEMEAILRRRVIRLILFRAKGLEQRDYLQMARQLSDLASRYGSRIMLNRQGAIEGEDFAGCHLNSAQLMAITEKNSCHGLLSASCHTLEEIEQANRLELDFILLSPVQQTLSHPDAVPLGWGGFHELVEQARMPVYALGGMTLLDLPEAQRHGAQGIAAIRGLWSEQIS